MHPAFSVVFLTTFIGVGQGLFMALYTAQVFSLLGIIAPPPADFYTLGSSVAFGWLGAGLFASLFHLGRPERGWRALTRWRSSWLSREVLILPVVMITIAVYGAIHWSGINPLAFNLNETLTLNTAFIAGLAATVLTVLLFLCTGMIYADVHLLPEWRHWLTVFNFLLLGIASGFTAAVILAYYFALPHLLNFYASWAIILTGVAAVTRGAALIRTHNLLRRSTLRTAIGVRHHQISQKSQGAMAGSFNTREFFHGHKPQFVSAIRNIFLILVFAVPMVFLTAILQSANNALVISAFCAQLFGLLAERWYFFAQVRHPQNLYYQSVA